MSVQDHTAVPQDKPLTPIDTPVKSRSTWNNFCITVKKGCTKVGQFFKKIFQAIGNGFKAIGNFLWNNKVTVAIVAGLSTVALAISTLFLVMLGKKKQQSNDESTKPVKAPAIEPKADEHPQAPENSSVDKTPINEMGNDKFANSRNRFEHPQEQKRPEKQRVDISQNTGLIKHKIQQIEESKQEPKVDTVIQVTSGSHIKEMKNSLEESQQQKTVKQPNRTDGLHSSVNMDDAHDKLANIKFGLGGPPPRSKIEIEKKSVTMPEEEKIEEEKSTNSRLDSSTLKGRPKGRPGRRLPAKYQRLQTTTQNQK